jgi:triosephosphate isomerase (TIM)
MRRPVIAGNWKMNTCQQSAGDLVSALAAEVSAPRDDVDVVVCPPAPYLALVVAKAAGSGVQVGGQNAWHESSGAFTGETACEMLTDLGCGWVILGHSERRHILGETDSLINLKVKKALDSNLQIMLCCGELLEERESNTTEAVLATQLEQGLADITSEQMSDIVIAYEPVWAIGTGKVATDEQAEETHAFVRKWLGERFGDDVASATRILYGGSVKPDNAVGLLGQPNVDGALVGGASLKPELFIPIIQAGIGSVA